MPKKKVIFFTSGTVGGAERVTLTIAKMLPATEYEVKIIHVCKSINNLDKFIPSHIEQGHLKIKNIWDFTISRLIRLLLKEHPYAVFSSLHYLNVRVTLAAKITGVPKIIMRNNIGWKNWKYTNKILAKLLYPFATKVISQSKEMNEEFVNSFKDSQKFIEIPNPIDFDTIEQKLKSAENPLDSQKTNYVFVGRIDSQKGLDTLITAFPKVLANYPEAFLTIVGDTCQNREYYAQLKELIIKYKIESYVKFVGFQNNPYKFIKHASCFVLPSRLEGNPNVLHEAMWLRIPVVASDCVPIISQIVSPERGEVVSVDDVDALANAMISSGKKHVTQPYNYSGGNIEFVSVFKE